MVDFVASVELVFSKNLLAPLQEVIEKKFMKCVENFGNKEGGYFTMQPVSPEWQMNSGQQKGLGHFLEAIEKPWIDVAPHIVD